VITAGIAKATVRAEKITGMARITELAEMTDGCHTRPRPTDSKPPARRSATRLVSR
jgi:hypothetical protein